MTVTAHYVMTTAQKAVLRAVFALEKKTDFGLTLQQIGDILGKTRQGVQYSVDVLVREGYLIRKGTRTIRSTAKAKRLPVRSLLR